MHRQPFFICIPGLLLLAGLHGCIHQPPKSQSETMLVQEGMSKRDVDQVLGKPSEVDTTGAVYNVEAGKIQKIERWIYEKRTIVFINDTLVSADEKPKN